MVLRPFRLFATFGVALLATGIAFSQTDVVINGSFESGLTGWTAAPSTTGNGVSTTCGYNASTAAGTETLSGTASLPPSAGTQLAMGSAQDHGAVDSSCVLYQDVAIPAGATSATLSLKWGLKYVGAIGYGSAALLARLYSSTATVPYFTDTGVGGTGYYESVSSDAILVSGSSASFNVTGLAGTTARLALFIALTPSSSAGRYAVGGFDEVHLLVTAPATIGKSFGAANIPFNGSTSLSFTITQPTVASATLTGAAFTDNLPAGLVVATPNGLTGSCGGGTITAVAASSSVTLSGGTVEAGSSCTFSVNVTGTTAGVKNNSVHLTSTNGGTGNTSNASVTVGPPPPTVTSVSPNSGPTAGGNSVTITGTTFTGATSVTFGGTAATSFSVVNATSITATVPAGTAGAVSVIVTTPAGSNAANALYTYVPGPTVTSVSPNSGSTLGGTSVTITGTTFTGATSVTFGGAAATGVAVVNATTITATTPAGAAGAASVIVTTTSGSNAANTLYTYIPGPTVTSVSPNSGPTAGGTSVTITGTTFTGATGVTFGGAAATSVAVVDATTITATTPAGAAGAASVIVTTPVGSSPANTLYTYIPLPTVTSVSPDSGSPAGGTVVTITGTTFTGATSVTFGGVAASFTVVNATTITATVPAGTVGAVSVIVTTPAGSNPANTLYTYGVGAVASPTLGEWGMIGLTGLLMSYGWSSLRRRHDTGGTA
jgi:hypothetical protein